MERKSLEKSSGARTELLEVLIGPALAAHVLLFLLLAREKPGDLAAEARTRMGTPSELEVVRHGAATGVRAEFEVAGLFGPYNLAPEAPSSGALEAFPRP